MNYFQYQEAALVGWICGNVESRSENVDEKIVLDEHNKRSYLILLFEDQITLYRVFAGGSKG